MGRMRSPYFKDALDATLRRDEDAYADGLDRLYQRIDRQCDMRITQEQLESAFSLGFAYYAYLWNAFLASVPDDKAQAVDNVMLHAFLQDLEKSFGGDTHTHQATQRCVIKIVNQVMDQQLGISRN